MVSSSSNYPRPQVYAWPDLERQQPTPEPAFVPTSLHLVAACPARATAVPTSEPGPALHLQAQELVEQARQQAEEIRRQVREEEARRTRAVAEQALRESAAEQVAAFRQAADDLLDRTRRAFEDRLAHIEQQCATLVTAMVEKIIGVQLQQDDRLVVEVVRRALAEATGADQITVRVSPHDEELVRAAQAELLAVLGATGGLQVVADDSISRGGCIVDTERGRFDARIETQLELLSEEAQRLLKAS